MVPPASRFPQAAFLQGPLPARQARTDHIGRPVFATNSAGVKVWEATYLPFGGVHTSAGNLPTARFPGQWFQSESGLHQNWMRDYDPTTGRYLEPDPLGLVDGASVYGYVEQNPARWIDPQGLEIRVYTSGQAFGTTLGNHAFAYGTECDCLAGTGGSSGVGGGDNGGNMNNRPYRVVSLPDGMSEQEFIDGLREYLDLGPYIPGVWDCHSQLEFAFWMMGVRYPGAPRGRSDIDEKLEEWVYWKYGIPRP